MLRKQILAILHYNKDFCSWPKVTILHKFKTISIWTNHVIKKEDKKENKKRIRKKKRKKEEDASKNKEKKLFWDLFYSREIRVYKCSKWELRVQICYYVVWKTI